MAIELDHHIVSAKDARHSAKTLGRLLGVDWAAQGSGLFRRCT